VTQPLQVGDKTVIAKGAVVTGAVAGESGKKKFLGIGDTNSRSASCRWKLSTEESWPCEL